MKPVDVTSSTYIDFGIENNDKDPTIKVKSHVRVSKYENIFAKVYIPYWGEEVFVIKKLKTLCLGHMLLVILMMDEEIDGMFY